jgi:hypothetical protein
VSADGHASAPPSGAAAAAHPAGAVNVCYVGVGLVLTGLGVQSFPNPSATAAPGLAPSVAGAE